MVSVTLKGQVIDENGVPLSNVELKLNDATTTSNQTGHFSLSATAATNTNNLLQASLTGYLSNFYSFKAAANQTYNTTIALSQSDVNQTKPVSSTTNLFLPNGSKVELPANGVTLMDGSVYTGTNITINAKALDSDMGLGFHAQIPGNTLSGIDANGESKELLSFGMLNVELQGDNGEDLQLAQGQSATLYFNIPTSQQADAPNTLTLWYFDETAGLWKEEGTATRQGNKYMGIVNHFTTWCCCISAPPAYVSGCVVDSSGNPVVNTPLLVNQRQVHTDASGCFTTSVLAQYYPITIKSVDYQLLQSCLLHTVTIPLAQNTTHNVGNISCSSNNTINWIIQIPDTVVGILGNPVTVPIQIKDSLNQFIPNQQINATVMSGGGSVLNNLISTNSSGIALILWQTQNIGTQSIRIQIGSYSKIVVAKHVTITLGSMTDPRDNEVYQTMTVGNQTWFTDNLRYDAPYPYVDTFEIAKPHYGRIYNWIALTLSTPASNSVPSGIQGVCPPGWHVPSDAEFNILEIALGLDPSQANLMGERGYHGAAMKSGSGWIWGQNGMNTNFFNVVPVAFGNVTVTIRAGSAIWTTSKSGSDEIARIFGAQYNGVNRAVRQGSQQYACRCVQD